MSNISFHLGTTNWKSIGSPPIHEWFRVLICSAYIATAVAGVLANILLCFATYRQKEKRRAIHLLALNLVCSNVITLLLFVPMQLEQIYSFTKWESGSVGCRLFHFTGVSTITACMLTLVAITRSRYVAITDPLSTRNRGSLAVKKWLPFIWISSIALSVPLFVIADNVHEEYCYELRPNTVGSQSYWIIVFLLHLIFPLVYFMFAYSIIVHRLKTECLRPEVVDLYKAMGKYKDKTRQTWILRRKKQQTKLVKLSITLVTTYVICVTPKNVDFLVVTFGSRVFDSNAIYVIVLSNFLAVLYSLISPLIFASRSKEVHRLVEKMVCSCKHNYGAVSRWLGHPTKDLPRQDSSSSTVSKQTFL